jgi:hypothetical protein
MGLAAGLFLVAGVLTACSEQQENRHRNAAAERGSASLPTEPSDQDAVDFARALLAPGTTVESIRWASSLPRGRATFEGVLGFGFEKSVFAAGTCRSADPHHVLWAEIDFAAPKLEEALSRTGHDVRSDEDADVWLAVRVRGEVTVGAAGHLDLYAGKLRIAEVHSAEPCLEDPARPSW